MLDRIPEFRENVFTIRGRGLPIQTDRQIGKGRLMLWLPLPSPTFRERRTMNLYSGVMARPGVRGDAMSETDEDRKMRQVRSLRMVSRGLRVAAWGGLAVVTGLLVHAEGDRAPELPSGVRVASDLVYRKAGDHTMR